MARSRLGRALTEDHKQGQIHLVSRFYAASRVLLGELDPTRLDATVLAWAGLQLVLAESFHRDSTRLAESYLGEFRIAETSTAAAAAMPIVRPVFDAAGVTEKLALVAPMAKLGTVGGLRPQDAVDRVFWQLVAGWGRHVQAGGRDLIDQSTLANTDSTGWRRVSDGSPCAWCAMLVTRGPAYRSAITAGEGRRFHDRCGCTVEEVFGDWVPTAAEQRLIDAYEASHRPGMSAEETAAAMRENGQGVLNDAHTPKTQTGGSGGGGGRRPPRSLPAGAPDEYPPTGGNQPPFTPETRPAISSGSRNHILQGHRWDSTMPTKTRFPREWSDDQIMEAVDLTMAAPDRVQHFGDQFTFRRTVNDVVVHVRVRVDKPNPFVWTAYPGRGE